MSVCVLAHSPVVVKNKQSEIILHCLYNLAAVSLATGLSAQICHWLSHGEVGLQYVFESNVLSSVTVALF